MLGDCILAGMSTPEARTASLSGQRRSRPRRTGCAARAPSVAFTVPPARKRTSGPEAGGYTESPVDWMSSALEL